MSNKIEIVTMDDLKNKWHKCSLIRPHDGFPSLSQTVLLKFPDGNISTGFVGIDKENTSTFEEYLFKPVPLIKLSFAGRETKKDCGLFDFHEQPTHWMFIPDFMKED